jgi:DHA2 family multidrug resistance protein
VTTLNARHMQQHLNDLGRNVTQYSALTRQMLQQMMQGFMGRGMDQATAMKQAYAAINGMVEQQAAMLAYTDVFFILAVMFLACIPLILLMKKPKKGGGGPGMGAH